MRAKPSDMYDRGPVLSEASDRDLVIAFQAGDKAAYDEIYRRHLPRVKRVCRRMLVCPHDVDEATQETFIKAYQALGRFNGSYLLGPWLARIATNACVDQLRSNTRGASMIALPGDVEPTETASSPEDVLLGDDPRIESALGEMHPLHARALKLRAVEGLSHREIAARLEMSPPQVKALLHRARCSFRRAWDKVQGWALAPLVALRSLTTENGAGSATGLPVWSLTSLPSSPVVAERITATAVAAALAFTPVAVSAPADDSRTAREPALATADSRPPRSDVSARRIAFFEEPSVTPGSAHADRAPAAPSKPASGAHADPHEEPTDEPVLPGGVEPPQPPDPPKPPDDPTDGGGEPPIGPSGAENPTRRVFRVVNDVLDSIPSAPST